MKKLLSRIQEIISTQVGRKLKVKNQKVNRSIQGLGKQARSIKFSLVLSILGKKALSIQAQSILEKQAVNILVLSILVKQAQNIQVKQAVNTLVASMSQKQVNHPSTPNLENPVKKKKKAADSVKVKDQNQKIKKVKKTLPKRKEKLPEEDR